MRRMVPQMHFVIIGMNETGFELIDSNADGTLLEYLALVEDPRRFVNTIAVECQLWPPSSFSARKRKATEKSLKVSRASGSSNKRRLKSHKIDPYLLNYSVGSRVLLFAW
ncbi:hypothetical protein Plhal304r1_c033g0104671 [Plasmopara halstedii]